MHARLVAAMGLKESEERQGPLWWGAVHERGRRRPPCWKHHLCFSFHQRESPSGMAPPLVSIRERSWTGKAVVANNILPKNSTVLPKHLIMCGEWEKMGDASVL